MAFVMKYFINFVYRRFLIYKEIKSSNADQIKLEHDKFQSV